MKTVQWKMGTNTARESGVSHKSHLLHGRAQLWIQLVESTNSARSTESSTRRRTRPDSYGPEEKRAWQVARLFFLSLLQNQKSVLRISPQNTSDANRLNAVDRQSESRVSSGLVGVAQKLDVPHADIAQNLGANAMIFRVELGRCLTLGFCHGGICGASSANPPPCLRFVEEDHNALACSFNLLQRLAILDPFRSPPEMSATMLDA